MIFLVFLVLSVTRPRPLLSQVLVGTFNHETLLHKNVTVIVFFIVCKIYFLLVLSKRSIGNKERVRTCKDYVISREITTMLKIAVDSITVELCDTCDYFVSPLLLEKTD